MRHGGSLRIQRQCGLFKMTRCDAGIPEKLRCKGLVGFFHGFTDKAQFNGHLDIKQCDVFDGQTLK